ncbi:hypothetical protein KY285_034131 [Solanum tuberosum]|nr:hypothetical protein KY285_034131 [Solanum tuberosum]
MQSTSNPLRSSSPFCCLSDNITAGIQGARHAQFGVPLLDLHLSNNLPSRLLPPSFQRVAANSQLPNVINKYQNDKVIRPENSGVLQLKCIPYP